MDQSDLELIRGVRATPALFNPMDADFKFAHRKEKIWGELASYLGINICDARRRWTCLRDRYSRGLKVRRLNPKTDYGEDDFFKEMDFLRPFVRKRRERRSIICKINKNISWNGKIEKQNFNVAENSNKLETIYTTEDVNEEEMYQEYEEEKSNAATKTINSSNVLVEAESAGSEDSYGDCRVQFTSENSPLNNDIAQDCHVMMDDRFRSSSKASKLGSSSEPEDDFFCKSICAYLRQLSRVHKIKAKVEMFQILEKYIEIEES